MARTSFKTLQKDIETACAFYGKPDITGEEYRRWKISPFLARTFQEYPFGGDLFAQINRDLKVHGKAFDSEGANLKGFAVIIDAAADKFIKRLRVFLGAVAAILLILSLAKSGDGFADMLGTVWAVYIGSSLLILFITDAIRSVYVSRLPSYQLLISALRPQYSAYRESMEHWSNLSWQDFEREVTKRLTDFGYHAVNTKFSGDEGVDVVVQHPGGKKFVIQCKAMKAKIGPAFVRDFIGTIRIQGAVGGMIVSMSEFTDISLETASSYPNVHLFSIQGFLLLDRQGLSRVIGW